MTEQFSNLAQTTLASSISSGATSLSVASAANFPASGKFCIVIDQEIFLVTTVSGTTFTVTPGYENTTQAAHSSGAAVAHILTAGVINQIYNAANLTVSPRIQAFGDSRASSCGLNVSASSSTFYAPAQWYLNRSPIAWTNRFLRGRLSFDLSLGYVGLYQAISKVIVLNGGSNYSASPSVSAGGPGSGVVFGTPTVVGGVITSVPVTTQGINFSSLPTLTVTDATGSGAVLQAVIGGTGTFGNAGETSTQCVNRLADIVAAPVDIVFVTIGTNDLTNGISAATTKANLKTILDTLIAAGKFVVFCPDQARSYWAALSGGQITNARHQMYNVNRWVYNYALVKNGQNSNGSKKILLCDGWDFWADATSSNGDPLSGMTSDGLHWSAASAQAMGLRLAQQLQPLLGFTSPAMIVSQADGYDATYNPDGALNFGWLMNASPNTPSSPFSGSIAGNFGVFRGSGSATGTAVGSIESTRTDGLSGSRQVITFSLGSGTSSELYYFGFNGTISAYNISVGDTIMAECDMFLSGQAKVNGLMLQILIQDGSSNTLMDARDGDTVGDAFQNSGAYLALNGDSTPMTFKTPPFTVPSNAATINCYAVIGFNASGGAGSATATWKIANFRVHKVV